MLISLYYILKSHVFALGCSRRPGWTFRHNFGGDACLQIKENADGLFHNLRWLWFPEGRQTLLKFLFFTSSGFCGLLAFGESRLLAFGESSLLGGTSTFSRYPVQTNRSLDPSCFSL